MHQQHDYLWAGSHEAPNPSSRGAPPGRLRDRTARKPLRLKGPRSVAHDVLRPRDPFDSRDIRRGTDEFFSFPIFRTARVHGRILGDVSCRRLGSPGTGEPSRAVPGRGRLASTLVDMITSGEMPDEGIRFRRKRSSSSAPGSRRAPWTTSAAQAPRPRTVLKSPFSDKSSLLFCRFC